MTALRNPVEELRRAVISTFVAVEVVDAAIGTADVFRPGSFVGCGAVTTEAGSISLRSHSPGVPTGLPCKMTARRRRSSRLTFHGGGENGPGGGRTGASGRGGISVRGTTGGGGVTVAGCPSASRNLRIRSSSVCTGARGSGRGAGGGDVDVRSVSLELLPTLLAAFVNN